MLYEVITIAASPPSDRAKIPSPHLLRAQNAAPRRPARPAVRRRRAVGHGPLPRPRGLRDLLEAAASVPPGAGVGAEVLRLV